MSRILVLAAALAVLPAAAAAQSEVRLYALDCGQITALDAGVFADDGAYDGVGKALVDPCYLIRHPAGDLLWDTGVPEGIADAPDGVTSPPFAIRVPHRLTDQLAALDLTPADIEFLSVSHGHFDHIGNANLFAGSTWIVDADERAWLFRDEARTGQEFPAYSALEQAETILIEGDADHDVFGDGSVTIHQAPGHTPGHTVLLVRLAEAGSVLLTGDMWHIAESREARRVPTFNTDRAATLASMDKVEALAAGTGALVVRQHVPDDFAALPAFPDYLD